MSRLLTQYSYFTGQRERVDFLSGKFASPVLHLARKGYHGIIRAKHGNVVCFSALKTRSFVSIFRMLISEYLFWGASTLKGCSTEVRWPIPKFPNETHSFSSITFQRTQNYLLKMPVQKIRYSIFLMVKNEISPSTPLFFKL